MTEAIKAKPEPIGRLLKPGDKVVAWDDDGGEEGTVVEVDRLGAVCEVERKGRKLYALDQIEVNAAARLGEPTHTPRLDAPADTRDHGQFYIDLAEGLLPLLDKGDRYPHPAHDDVAGRQYHNAVYQRINDAYFACYEVAAQARRDAIGGLTWIPECEDVPANHPAYSPERDAEPVAAAKGGAA